MQRCSHYLLVDVVHVGEFHKFWFTSNVFLIIFWRSDEKIFWFAFWFVAGNFWFWVHMILSFCCFWAPNFHLTTFMQLIMILNATWSAQSALLPCTGSFSTSKIVLMKFLRNRFSIFHKINNQLTMQRNESFHQSKNFNLIDDSVLEDSSSQHTSLHLPLQQNDAISTGSSEEIIPFDGDYNETSIINNLDSPLDCLSFQGCVRRKTVLKDGRKPTVASWQRYWLQIWANSLVYFPPKSFKGWDISPRSPSRFFLLNFYHFRSERSDFKREPCKVSSLDGWTVELTENSSQTNTFQLINSAVGTVYKFRCSSHDLTIAWLKALQKITRPYVEKLPTNLMTFEWNLHDQKMSINYQCL